jgi:hypothetical protein
MNQPSAAKQSEAVEPTPKWRLAAKAFLVNQPKNSG